MFEALEVGAHPFAAPRIIVCNPGDLIPITAWPADRDHCVVKCAAAHGRCSGIEDPIFFSIPLGVGFLWVRVMLNKELPTEVQMFAGVRMKCWNLCDLRSIPAACLQHEHMKTVLGQISSKRSATCPGADDDEIVLC